MVRLSLRTLSFNKTNVILSSSPGEDSPETAKLEKALSAIARINGDGALTSTPPTAAPEANSAVRSVIPESPLSRSSSVAPEADAAEALTTAHSETTFASPAPRSTGSFGNPLVSPLSATSWSAGLQRAVSGISQYTGQSLVACLYVADVTPARPPKGLP